MIILLIIDQITKYFAKRYDVNIELIDNFMTLNYIENYGVAFSFLNEQYLVIIISNILILAVLIYIFSQNKIRKYDYLLAVMIAGGIGNIIDRLLFGFVIDFIEIEIGTYGFPIFNFADMYLTIGAFIFIISTLKDEKKEKNGNNLQ